MKTGKCTEFIDKLFLELSQFTNATTNSEFNLMEVIEEYKADERDFRAKVAELKKELLHTKMKSMAPHGEPLPSERPLVLQQRAKIEELKDENHILKSQLAWYTDPDNKEE